MIIQNEQNNNYGITMAENFKQILFVNAYDGDWTLSVDVMFVNQSISGDKGNYKLYFRPNFAATKKISDFALLKNILEIKTGYLELINFSFSLSAETANGNIPIKFGENDQFNAESMKLKISDDKHFNYETDWIFATEISYDLINQDNVNNFIFDLHTKVKSYKGNLNRHTKGVISINLKDDGGDFVYDNSNKITNINTRNEIFIYMNYNSDTKEINWFNSAIIENFKINYENEINFFNKPIRKLFKITKSTYLSSQVNEFAMSSFKNISSDDSFNYLKVINEFINKKYSFDLPMINVKLNLPADNMKKLYEENAQPTLFESKEDNQVIDVSIDNNTVYNPITKKIELDNNQKNGFVLNPNTIGKTNLDFEIMINTEKVYSTISVDQIVDSDETNFLDQSENYNQDFFDLTKIGFLKLTYEEISQYLQEDLSYSIFQQIIKEYWVNEIK
ncbi:hypothetical protein [Spiroplasma endosymbiont of Labia minor]|uniref:hypothetical protein n=1 Tax=Spiroplasma endosymbiont of Labia minor TaxID=3066305 RepID=UPI0030CBD15B